MGCGGCRLILVVMFMAASGGWLNMDYGYSGRWLILGSGWWQWVVVGDFVFIYIYIYCRSF